MSNPIANALNNDGPNATWHYMQVEHMAARMPVVAMAMLDTLELTDDTRRALIHGLKAAANGYGGAPASPLAGKWLARNTRPVR